MNKIKIINLWPIETECTICGKHHVMENSLPMYEGEVLLDDYEGEWAGMPVCNKCYKKHRTEE